MRDFVEERVSIVFPVYGDFDERRLLVSVESAINQEYDDLEIIVSEQGPEPKFSVEDEFSSEHRINHVFEKHVPSPHLSDYEPGRVRNNGVLISTGEYVYTNDADIVLVNPRFISKMFDLKKRNEGSALFRPPLRRLPEDEFEPFFNQVRRGGFRQALSKLDFSKDYIATLNTREWEVRTHKKQGKDFPYEKTFTAFKQDFDEYVNNPELRGEEPVFWGENRFCGGNFFRITQFYGVGGYCEKFVNWGCEDSDLQYKLGEKYGLKLVPFIQGLEVIHLDHPKNYFSSEMWKRNERIEEARRAKSIEEIIGEDSRILKCRH